MKRAVLILLAAAGAAVALGPGPAGAGESSNDTIVTSEPLAGGGYKLVVSAAPGQANVLLGHNDLCGGTIRKFCVSDDVGITDDSPRCEQVDPKRVACKLQGLRRLRANTGDKADAVRAEDIGSGTIDTIIFLTGPGADRAAISEVPDLDFSQPSDATFMGRGRDEATITGEASVRGGRGGDTLRGRRGNQRLFGGRGGDKITGGRGNNDHCDGDGGNDSGGGGCETKVSL